MPTLLKRVQTAIKGVAKTVADNAVGDYREFKYAVKNDRGPDGYVVPGDKPYREMSHEDKIKALQRQKDVRSGKLK